MMKRYFKSLYKIISLSNKQKHSHLLNKIYPDDRFLIGYPKSGNTWIRFLIGNYLTGNKCDFKNYHLIVPGIIEHPEQCGKLKRPRFMHTHATFQSLIDNYATCQRRYGKLVFIVRDGRDVAVSYYFHLKKHGQIDLEMKFADYLEYFNIGKFHPGQKWGEYINKWLENNTHNENFLMIRYEDLKEDAERELIRILRFTGLRIERNNMLSAINASDFETMRNLEKIQQEKHFRLKYSDKSIRFIRNGETNQWKRFFNSHQLERFFEIHGKALNRLGYVS